MKPHDSRPKASIPPAGPLSALPGPVLEGPPAAKDKKKRTRKTKAEKSTAAAAAAFSEETAAAAAKTTAGKPPAPAPKGKPASPKPGPVVPKLLIVPKTTSGVAATRPKAGYACHACGQAGGLANSHWKQFCPSLWAGGVGSLPGSVAGSPRRQPTPPASPRGSSSKGSARSSGTSRTASAESVTTTSSMARDRARTAGGPAQSIGYQNIKKK